MSTAKHHGWTGHGPAPGSPAAPTHECPIAGCARQIPFRLLMCWWHWRRVPRKVQAIIWATVHDGPSEAYEEAVREAIAVVEAKEDAERGVQAP